MAYASGRIVGTSWTDLSTSSRRTGRDGQLGFVPSTDAGTHTGYYIDSSDGLVKQTTGLANAGTYVWVASVNAWARTEEVKEINVVTGRVVSIDTYRSSDSGDIMALLKSLLENDSAERRDMMTNNTPLYFRGGVSYLGLTRPLITLPRYLRVVMDPSAYIDFSVSGQFADNLLSYSGRYGMPTRPVTADYLYGTISIAFGSGVVASRGWQRGDRLLIRATEGLSDQLVGAFQKVEYDASTPATFSFFAASTSYSIGDGVISVADGKSYRCTSAHTSGANIDLTKFAITGLNAISEDIYIDAIVGDTIYLTAPLRYSYPTAAKPIFTKYEDGGSHVFENFQWIGNHPVDAIDKGAWVTSTAYVVGDMVYAATAIGGANRYYTCLENHTSGTFATDLSGGKWVSLGSDRVMRFALSDRVHLIGGGRMEASSGRAIDAFSVADFLMRDHTGFAANKRAAPGGYLAIGGGYNKALLDNVTIHGGSQPFMGTVSGGEYGVSYGTVMRDCTAKGGSSGFTQHSMQDANVYDNCEHDGGLAAPGGSSFDIRTPSRLTKCRSINSNGRGIVLRSNFGGFGRDDNSNTGTVIHGFEAHNVLTGIDLDNTLYNAGAGTVGHPTGRLEIRDAKLTRIGGTGSNGAIRLMWTVGTGGVVGTGPYPLLGRWHLQNINISMKSDQHAVRLAGRLDRPFMRDIRVVPADGFTPNGSFRSFLINDGAVSGENKPINPDIDGLFHTGGFLPPTFTILRDTDPLPTIASATTMFIDSAWRAFFVSGTTTINYITECNLLKGQIIVLIAQGSVTVNHNAGPGFASSIKLAGGSNRNLTAGDRLMLLSDGVFWYEIGFVDA